ncbi:MAG: DUF1549 domain-containing protein, partial [Planctomycetes bacterium]|nr:DUF1549 domain-containing protein [Planctomycetota bacterium]
MGVTAPMRWKPAAALAASGAAVPAGKSGPMGHLTTVTVIRSAAVVVALLAAAVSASEPALDFNRDIRPLLSDRCFACHGPDAEDRQAGLRLDLREHAVRPLDSGTTAVVPGKPTASELLARVRSIDPAVMMPPPSVGKPITAAEADQLARWIAGGAAYRGHWAFERIVRPHVPEVRDRTWPRTPIDRFVLARLEAEGLEPNPEADRGTLARRLALDLTGLPPDPAAVDAFLADSRPDAYETYVDTLLASPHYGERMAIEWLDAARYADSHGYQTDSSRSNWPWRDWLIRAYNANLPFDRFTIAQLAGDMLDEPTRDQIVATGFSRNHRINGEGGIIAEEWRVETVIDRVETTGQTWLGLTVGCARCHDHKYDPLTQKEFYGLFAVFNNVPETGTIIGSSDRAGGNSDPLFDIPQPDQEAELARLEKLVADAETVVAGQVTGIDTLVAEWERSLGPALAAADGVWRAFEPLAMRSVGGGTFRRSEDGVWFVEGALPPRDTYEFESLLPGRSFGGLRLEVMPDTALPGGGFGRAGNGNIVVSGIEVEVRPAGGGPAVPVKLVRAEADYEQRDWPAAAVLEGKQGRGWAIDGNDPAKRRPRRLAVFPAAAVPVEDNARLMVRVQQEALEGHAFGKFRLAISGLEPALLGAGGATLPPEVAAALAVDEPVRTPPQREALRTFYHQKVDGPIRRAEAARDAARKSLAEFRGKLPTAMVMKEGPPRDAFVLLRGEYDKPGEKVTASLPAFLPPLPSEAKADRLGLARWIVARDNPLTARVWVNRGWERFFGTGLSKTSENLGSQAEYPSHPELLDWMATEFIEGTSLPTVAGRPAGPWDMKAFIKLLVTSAAYRQSAAVTPDKLARDPANRL